MGTSTDTEVTILYQEMKQLASHISLPLAKWTTISNNLQEMWKQENIPFKNITQFLRSSRPIRSSYSYCEDLFQDTWLSGIQWDEILPPAVAQQGRRINELQCQNDIHIPRWISPSNAVTIQVLGDASVCACDTYVGRLQFFGIPFDTQHPLLPNGNHPFVHLLIQHNRIRLHHLSVRIISLRVTLYLLDTKRASSYKAGSPLMPTLEAVQGEMWKTN
ncbi:integrase_H2C2 domain-containing protein [Nephila pilipes]|uniref:Integrase_H2C2 domain-containing protein n=1 Tax=Nephila pilipes TaxID=299642 RepID=A0A8X6NFQ1_NEPPI|nr:integrase_H2C2 domain-containing protein [Nephila pilipes]